jgi:tRNA pseudouridine55 synthase
MFLIDGMLLIDKPSNITSFKVCDKIKKTLNAKKTGHCGTLDPSATGLLLVLINKATKLQNQFMKQGKTYRTSFQLGIRTDTGDLDGKILEQRSFNGIDMQLIDKTLENFRGEIEQMPHMYSAVKIKGRKMYEFARKGIEVERKSRKVNVKKLEIMGFTDGILDLIIECSSGVYVRSIADDMGKLLGCGAAVSFLRREKIGDFDVKDAVSEEYFKDADFLKNKIISLGELNER